MVTKATHTFILTIMEFSNGSMEQVLLGAALITSESALKRQMRLHSLAFVAMITRKQILLRVHFLRRPSHLLVHSGIYLNTKTLGMSGPKIANENTTNFGSGEVGIASDISLQR